MVMLELSCSSVLVVETGGRVYLGYEVGVAHGDPKLNQTQQVEFQLREMILGLELGPG